MMGKCEKCEIKDERHCSLTTMEVRSSLSKRLMAWSRDLYMAAEIRWVMRRFRSMERPRSCGGRGGVYRSAGTGHPSPTLQSLGLKSKVRMNVH